MLDWVADYINNIQWKINITIHDFFDMLYWDVVNIFMFPSSIWTFVSLILIVFMIVIYVHTVFLNIWKFTKKEILLKSIVLLIWIFSVFWANNLIWSINDDWIHYINLTAITSSWDKYYWAFKESKKIDWDTNVLSTPSNNVDLTKSFNKIYINANNVLMSDVIYKDTYVNLSNINNYNSLWKSDIKDIIIKEFEEKEWKIIESLNEISQNYNTYWLDIYSWKIEWKEYLIPVFLPLQFISNWTLDRETYQYNYFYNEKDNKISLTSEEESIINDLSIISNNLWYKGSFVIDELNYNLNSIIKLQQNLLKTNNILSNDLQSKISKIKLLEEDQIKQFFKTESELKTLFWDNWYNIYVLLTKNLEKTIITKNGNNYILYHNPSIKEYTISDALIIDLFKYKIAKNSSVLKKYKEVLVADIEDIIKIIKKANPNINESILKSWNKEEFKKNIEREIKSYFNILKNEQIDISRYIVTVWDDTYENDKQLWNIILKNPISLYYNIKTKNFSEVPAFVNIKGVKWTILDAWEVSPLNIWAYWSYITKFDKDNWDYYNSDLSILQIPLTNKIFWFILVLLNMFFYFSLYWIIIYIYSRLLKEI